MHVASQETILEAGPLPSLFFFDSSTPLPSLFPSECLFFSRHRYRDGLLSLEYEAHTFSLLSSYFLGPPPMLVTHHGRSDDGSPLLP